MGFERHKKLLNKELEQFNNLLNDMLPRYVQLMKKKDITPKELKELGEMEHFLIEVNGKIAEIKTKLDHDLFGETISEYYRVKALAASGDKAAQQRLLILRDSFSESIKGDTFFNWN